MARTILALSAVALATVASAAAAQGEGTPVAAAFGNTIISTYPDGRTARLWLQSDGTYLGQGRRGDRSTGRWTLRGEKICLRQTRPRTLPITFCTPLPSGGVGAVWTAKAVTGERVRVRLASGTGA